MRFKLTENPVARLKVWPVVVAMSVLQFFRPASQPDGGLITQFPQIRRCPRVHAQRGDRLRRQ
jgi:hypothetical protein